MDFSSFKDATEALKTVYKGVKELSELQENIQAKQQALDLLGSVISVQQDIIQLQAELSAQQSKMDAIAAENIQLRAWGEDKNRYELHELAPGAVVYRVSQSHQRTGEPEHYLCTNCYHNNIKAILQANGSVGFQKRFTCHSCKSFVLYRHKTDNESMVLTTGRKTDWSGWP